jgi:dihydroxy-acid dehydratase
MAIVKEGDTISIDIDKYTIELEVSAEEMAARLKGWKAPEQHYKTGVFKKYVQLVGSASKGAVTC